MRYIGFLGVFLFSSLASGNNYQMLSEVKEVKLEQDLYQKQVDYSIPDYDAPVIVEETVTTTTSPAQYTTVCENGVCRQVMTTSFPVQRSKNVVYSSRNTWSTNRVTRYSDRRRPLLNFFQSLFSRMRARATFRSCNCN